MQGPAVLACASPADAWRGIVFAQHKQHCFDLALRKDLYAIAFSTPAIGLLERALADSKLVENCGERFVKQLIACDKQQQLAPRAFERAPSRVLNREVFTVARKFRFCIVCLLYTSPSPRD